MSAQPDPPNPRPPTVVTTWTMNFNTSNNSDAQYSLDAAATRREHKSGPPAADTRIGAKVEDQDVVIDLTQEKEKDPDSIVTLKRKHVELERDEHKEKGNIKNGNGSSEGQDRKKAKTSSSGLQEVGRTIYSAGSLPSSTLTVAPATNSLENGISPTQLQPKFGTEKSGPAHFDIRPAVEN
ncbi:hypothetical protein BDZ97DRAFT_1806175 [Flammula alnicola]|nr:hypothetical protein BDZ97DRAFT_1806175 [Flammula alnicola]